MPYLKVQTNQKAKDKDQLLKKMSQRLANKLKKPETYVLVSLEDDKDLIFGGTKEPAVFLELKSIGLKESMTEDLSDVFCSLVKEELGIPKDRIYIEFKDVPRKMWGWNGSTF